MPYVKWFYPTCLGTWGLEDVKLCTVVMLCIAASQKQSKKEISESPFNWPDAQWREILSFFPLLPYVIEMLWILFYLWRKLFSTESLEGMHMYMFAACQELVFRTLVLGSFCSLSPSEVLSPCVYI